jgi:hypothetical protein
MIASEKATDTFLNSPSAHTCQVEWRSRANVVHLVQIRTQVDERLHRLGVSGDSGQMQGCLPSTHAICPVDGNPSLFCFCVVEGGSVEEINCPRTHNIVE